MPKLMFSGEYYNGDGITAGNGDIVEVSAPKARQLLRDFPMHWRLVAEAALKKMVPETEKALRSPKNKAQRPTRNKSDKSVQSADNDRKE
ncbi:MAG: hypothetical protein JSV16_16255 [Candidatus Hydrogenedentota bacterium]|nr:MAG: hypothetical protein JSV16_16255 [Candidatus Hydrogenedentota bacterium]